MCIILDDFWLAKWKSEQNNLFHFWHFSLLFMRTVSHMLIIVCNHVKWSTTWMKTQKILVQLSSNDVSHAYSDFQLWNIQSRLKTNFFLCSWLLRTWQKMYLLLHNSNKYLQDNVFDMIKSLFFEKCKTFFINKNFCKMKHEKRHGVIFEVP